MHAASRCLAAFENLLIEFGTKRQDMQKITRITQTK